MTEYLRRLLPEIEAIEHGTGIELDGLEVMRLSIYKRAFASQGEGGPEARYRFLLDRFGLDMLELDRVSREMVVHGALRRVPYGMGLLRTPEFREYCRRKVDEWREEGVSP